MSDLFVRRCEYSHKLYDDENEEVLNVSFRSFRRSNFTLVQGVRDMSVGVTDW